MSARAEEYPHQPHAGANDIAPAVYDEKRAPSENTGAEEASLAMKPEQYAVTNSYDVDPFAANHDTAREDYLEFRTMGWLNAGLIGTAEVSQTSAYRPHAPTPLSTRHDLPCTSTEC